MKDRSKGILAVVGAYSIYGLNLVFCKELTSGDVMSPSLLFTFRAAGATALFWLLSLVLPKEKINCKDIGAIFLASMLGLFIPQMCTLWGITMSTPFDASVISTLKPLMTLGVAAVLLREPVPVRSVIGILVSLAGAVMLVFFRSGGVPDAYATSPLGLVVLLLNGLSFAVFLVLFRPLVKRYSAVTFMKWMFLFSLLASLPSGLADASSFAIGSMSLKLWGELAFIIVCATFVAYFLTPVGQKHLHPTEYSVYSYAQLLVAALAGVLAGMEMFTIPKLIAAAVMIAGVWISGKK